MLTNNPEKFRRTLSHLEHDAQVEQMKQYTQHRGTATFRHCHNVAVSNFRLAQLLGWNIDEAALARGAMLHDFHLYTRAKNDFRHLFRHPRIALQNAETAFADLSAKERNIITSHMWPLTLFAVPKSKEAVLVMLADKYCAAREMSRRSRKAS